MEFPFKTNLTLDYLIGYWELKQHDSNPIEAKRAKSLIKEVDRHPELRGKIEDMSLLEGHQNLLESLLSALLPSAQAEEGVYAAFKPFSMDYFFGSKSFHKLMDSEGCLGNMVDEKDMDEMMASKVMGAYQYILSSYYGISFPGMRSYPLRMRNDNGLIRYYHLGLNPKFCQIQVVGDLPALSKDDLNEIMDHLQDIDYLEEKLPPERFEFVGFGIYSMTDATEEVVLSQIKEALLKKESISGNNSLENLQEDFRSLLNHPDLELGITLFHKKKNTFFQVKTSSGKSLMADDDGHFYEPFHNLNQKLQNSKEPYLVKDIGVDPFFKDYGSLFKNLNSLLFCPLVIGDELVGILELGSKAVNAFSHFTHSLLSEVIPLFAIAAKRNTEEIENHLQSIIKEHYTSIHPSVEWRFTDAAYKILDQENKGKKVEPEEILFQNVYPLYGASDIRNSSVIRNEAIASDLTFQLKAARKVLDRVPDAENFPLLGELMYKIDRQVSGLKKGLLSGDESSILKFFHTEVEPVISSLEKEIPHFTDVSSQYWKVLDPKMKVVYRERKAFEDSLSTINDTVSTFLEQEQDKAQKVFPHFFEKYKTDGVEYNAYIGSALTNQKKFSSLHLRNLRLWQLLASVEVARQTSLLKDQLEVPLETTHLILVHSQPLSVRFRMDEKQFDVDGAYNMRYEIVKKRIDKVKIKDTNERLTQPGKIAVVFSDRQDIEEYIEFFKYLQNKGMISSKIEELALEELQGVNGLSALRVAVEPGTSSFMNEIEDLKKVALKSK